jgi:hypothetical protein
MPPVVARKGIISLTNARAPGPPHVKLNSLAPRSLSLLNQYFTMANQNGNAAGLPQSASAAQAQGSSDPKGKGKAAASEDVPQNRAMDEDDDDEDDDDDEEDADVGQSISRCRFAPHLLTTF